MIKDVVVCFKKLLCTKTPDSIVVQQQCDFVLTSTVGSHAPLLLLHEGTVVVMFIWFSMLLLFCVAGTIGCDDVCADFDGCYAKKSFPTVVICCHYY